MKILSIAGAFAMLASSATAQDVGETSVALGFSSFGGNIEAAYRIDPTYRVRGAIMGGISFDYEESDDDGDFEGDFNLGGLALLGDYYPLQNGWRVSGGLFFSTTELEATGTSDIDGVGEESITTTAKFSNEIAPMVTTGYDWGFADGWSLNSEIGLIFNGGIDIEYTATDPTVQDEVDADQDLQDAKDDAGDVSVLPYVGFTVSYQF